MRFLFFFIFFSALILANDYHIWIHGSRHAKHIFSDQFHSFINCFKKSNLELTESPKYKNNFGVYTMSELAPHKINFFYWGIQGSGNSSTRDGRLSGRVRKSAGEALYNMLFPIFLVNRNAKFHLYGFSHGGNVIAECIEKIYLAKTDLILDEVFFLDTPITNTTEQAIHKQTPNKQYIAQKIYNCYPKKRSWISWHLFDFTASFPCCASSFLFSRAPIQDDDVIYDLELDLSCHGDFGDENNILKVENGECTLKIDLSSKKEKKTSKNPLRWILYYRKCAFSLLFLYFIIQYMKKRNIKDELIFFPF